MRKILAWVTLLLLVALYAASSNEAWMKRIATWKYNSNSIFGSDKIRYGDLYGLCYLKAFKIPMTDDTTTIKPADCNAPRNINIYCYGDSYMYKYVNDSSVFCGVNQFNITRVFFQDHKIHISAFDKTKKNIVLICLNERDIPLDYMDTAQIYDHINYIPGNKIVDKIPPQSLSELLFNSGININLAFNIFDFTFFTPVREARASVNYHLFNRIDNKVGLSNNGHTLLWGATLDSARFTGYKHRFDTSDIDTFVKSMQNIITHYTRMGFDDVVFSITPSPAGVLNKGDVHYNNLANRILNDKRISRHTFNVQPEFIKGGEIYFLRSDSHWNKKGYKVWIDGFNAYLQKYFAN